jgi:chromosome partitioning protein
VSIIAVVNRKGGCGKSTLAVNLAARLAQEGHAVLLADLDRNRSASSWLRVRQVEGGQALAPIQACVFEPDKAFRRPAGVTHVVIDTPGGLQGFELARVACYADAILMPVGSSRFDREAAAASREELARMPRVASGRCQLAAVGMRVSPRNNATATLRRWAAEQDLPLIGLLRDTPLYSSCAERGYALFDLDPGQAGSELQAWAPLLAWLEPLVQAGARPQVEALRAFNASAPVLKPRALGSAAWARPGQALREPAQRAAEAGPERRLPAVPLLLPAGPGRAPGWRQRMGQVLQSWPLQRLLARSS